MSRNQAVGSRNQGVGDRNDLNQSNALPQFDQSRNQGVGNRNQAVGDRNQGISGEPGGRWMTGLGCWRYRNQAVGDHNQGISNQRTQQRGYGNQPNRGASNNAIAELICQQGGNPPNNNTQGQAERERRRQPRWWQHSPGPKSRWRGWRWQPRGRWRRQPRRRWRSQGRWPSQKVTRSRGWSVLRSTHLGGNRRDAPAPASFKPAVRA